jgi:hypothetical protein
MITINEVLIKDEGNCNLCVFISRTGPLKRPKVVFKISFHHGRGQSTSVRLCMGHLLELQSNVNAALDFTSKGSKKK